MLSCICCWWLRWTIAHCGCAQVVKDSADHMRTGVGVVKWWVIGCYDHENGLHLGAWNRLSRCRVRCLQDLSVFNPQWLNFRVPVKVCPVLLCQCLCWHISLVHQRAFATNATTESWGKECVLGVGIHSVFKMFMWKMILCLCPITYINIYKYTCIWRA